MNSFEKDLKKRQKEHIKNVQKFAQNHQQYQFCLHDSCPSCLGTGIKIDGTSCVHYLVCNCPKCNPVYFSGTGITNDERFNDSITLSKYQITY